MDKSLIERGSKALEGILSKGKIAGYFGKPDGSGGYTVPISHHPGFNYVRGSDGIEGWIGEAINMGALPDPANRLEIVTENGVLVVKTANAANAAYVYGANAPVGGQAPTINTPETGNALDVSAMALDGGRVTVFDPDGRALTGLNVRISEYVHRGGVWDGATRITLTPTATASMHAWVMVGINTKTNTITQALTVNRSLAQGLLLTDVYAVMAANPDVDWRGAVDLANGATAISVLKIINLRSFGQTNAKANYSASAAPTTGDDIDDGYAVGSVWIDTTADKVYTCTDNTAAAAVWKQTDGAGSVTSVGLSLPAEFSVTGSPVTTSGTLTGAWATQTTNKVFAAPNGSTGAPTFRALASADLTTALTTPPIIGGTTPAAITGTAVTATSNLVGGSIGSLTGVLSITAPASTNAIDVILNATPSNAIRVRRSDGTNIFTVSNIGRFSIRAITDDNNIFNISSSAGTSIYQIGTVNSAILFQLTGLSGQTGDYVKVLDSSSNTIAQITATGRLTLNGRDTTSTTTVVSGVTVGRNNNTSTPAAGFGTQILMRLESSTTEDTNIGSIDWLWNTATHASRIPDLVFNLTDSAATREIMRMRANGSASAIGFLGATPVARASAYTQTYSTAARTVTQATGIDNAQAGTVYAQATDVDTLAKVVNSLIDDLQALGLIA